MDEREKRLSEKLGPHRVRLDELNQPWFVGDVTTVALMLWAECLRLMAEREWVKVSPETMPPKELATVEAFRTHTRTVEIVFPIALKYGFHSHWREIVLPTEGGKE